MMNYLKYNFDTFSSTNIGRLIITILFYIYVPGSVHWLYIWLYIAITNTDVYGLSTVIMNTDYLESQPLFSGKRIYYITAIEIKENLIVYGMSLLGLFILPKLGIYSPFSIRLDLMSIFIISSLLCKSFFIIATSYVKIHGDTNKTSSFIYYITSIIIGFLFSTFIGPTVTDWDTYANISTFKFYLFCIVLVIVSALIGSAIILMCRAKERKRISYENDKILS